MVVCFRLLSPLFTEQQEEQEKGPDGHGPSLGSWPWQKLERVGPVAYRPSTNKDGGLKQLCQRRLTEKIIIDIFGQSFKFFCAFS